jgi:hypothetical protein
MFHVLETTLPSSYRILYVPGWSTSWMMNDPSQGGDSLLLTDKRRIPLRSASVRIPHLFHHGIPKVLANPRSKGITSVRSTTTHLATKTLTTIILEKTTKLH